MAQKRSASPVSENTLLDFAKESGLQIRFSDSDDGENAGIDDSDSEVVNSSENESEVVDDTDEDPTYEPLPGMSTSTGQFGKRKRILPWYSRPRPTFESSSSDEEDNVRPHITPPSPILTQTDLEQIPSPRPIPPPAFDVPIQESPIASRPITVRASGVRRGTQRRPNVCSRRPNSNRPNRARNPPRADDSSSWDEVEEDVDQPYNHNFTFSELSGPKHCPPPNSKPITYFYLFFTTSLLTTFVTETNRYASNFLRSNQLSPFSRLQNWTNVTLLEMKAFIAIIMNMGLIRKSSIKSYWDKCFTEDTPYFRKMMTRNRFQNILKFLHIVDTQKLANKGEPGYDPCGRFQPIIDHANRLFKTYYYPTQALSVDESLVGTKKRVALTQYIPKKKHHKWGIKLWVLCDSVTRYCLQFFCYKGADKSGVPETGLAGNVVMKLLEMGNYLHRGHHMYLDNFFTSIPLARLLYSKETHTTGTLRKDRIGIPKQLLGKYKVGQKCYVRKGPMLIMAHREKQSNSSQFLILSSDCQAKKVMYSIRRSGKNIIRTKTKIAHQYNMGMGGIDSTDQMLYVYLDERRTMKHVKKVIFNIMGRMVLNAYILYKLNTTEGRMKRVDFMRSLIADLSTEWLATRSVPDGGRGDGDFSPSTNSFGLRKLPEKKEKLCKICSGPNHPQGKKRRSRTICVRCGAGVHPECLTKHVCC